VQKAGGSAARKLADAAKVVAPNRSGDTRRRCDVDDQKATAFAVNSFQLICHRHRDCYQITVGFPG
jgi:hypothetical protein